MDSAFRIGTRMAMLYQGKIIEEAEPEKFKQSKNPVVAQFLSASTEGPILEASLDAITKKGNHDRPAGNRHDRGGRIPFGFARRPGMVPPAGNLQILLQ